VFVKGGVRELHDRLPGMMTLISLAITGGLIAAHNLARRCDRVLGHYGHPYSCRHRLGEHVARPRDVRSANPSV
jgi:hypothetical protein